VCEVRIRRRPEAHEGQLGLRIEPHTLDEMRVLIQEFAEDEWQKRRDVQTGERREDTQAPTPREVQRFIRNMTNTAISRVAGQGDRSKKKVKYDPLDDLAASHGSADALANSLLQRADLMGRTEAEWWFDGDEALESLEQKTKQVNAGLEPTAVLPRLIELFVEQPLPTSRYRENFEVIDTRGFDGQLGARSDILDRLRDERCIIVACSGFSDAPDESLRTLLRGVQADVTLQSALTRLVVVLPDQGKAAEVNGAEDDRELGQSIKEEECAERLRAEGLVSQTVIDSVTAHDCIRDETEGLVTLIDDAATRRLSAAVDALKQQMSDARSFLDNQEDHRINLARDEVDRRLQVWLNANPPAGRPIGDPLEGLYATIKECQYASRVHVLVQRERDQWGLSIAARAHAAACLLDRAAALDAERRSRAT
jgi:hypothetical protein